MKKIPDHLKAYRQTDIFTEKTMPAGLLKNHRTAENVWAKIIIVQGKLTYIIEKPVLEQIELVPGQSGVVEPGVYHHIIPHESAEFYIEFYE